MAMTGRRQRGGGACRGGLPALMFVVLAGLFGMHGLSSHGMVGHGEPIGPLAPPMVGHSMGPDAGSTETVGQIGSTPVHVDAHAERAAMATETAVERPNGHQTGSHPLGPLCVAVLTLLLALAARMRRLRPWGWLLRGVAFQPTRMPAIRHVVTPSLTLLCVRRC